MQIPLGGLITLILAASGTLKYVPGIIAFISVALDALNINSRFYPAGGRPSKRHLRWAIRGARQKIRTRQGDDDVGAFRQA